jgi:hypothetical protein
MLYVVSELDTEFDFDLATVLFIAVKSRVIDANKACVGTDKRMRGRTALLENEATYRLRRHAEGRV